jgi:Domain of unknown function (DUF4157)
MFLGSRLAPKRPSALAADQRANSPGEARRVTQCRLQGSLQNDTRMAAQQALAAAARDVPLLGPERTMSRRASRAPVQLQDGPASDGQSHGRVDVAQGGASGTEARRRNDTGLPDRLKSGIESLAGLSLDNVKVHYNSSQPARLNAHAYTRGSDIHVASGQERHLPHEAWHVVQQAQGRVQPTMQLPGSVPANGDPGLEQEATAMGARALSIPATAATGAPQAPVAQMNGNGPVQLWPPASEEEANQEIDEIKAAIFKKGVQAQPFVMGSFRGWVRIDDCNYKSLELLLTNQNLKIDPGTTGLAANVVLEKLQQLAKLRKWRQQEQAKSHSFGYGAVKSVGLPPPSPLQQTYGLSPFAPHLHGQPIGYAPQGSTFEMLGQDMMIREKSSEDLERQRSSSKAYREPAKTKKLLDKPTFSSTIYIDESTVLDKKRIHERQHEKRKEIANTGPYKGKKWPDQEAQLGMSALNTVRSYNATTSDKLPENVSYDWLHLFAFSMGGQDNWNPQDPKNFVVGTQFANYYHNIFEAIAKGLAKSGHRIMVHSRAAEPISVDWRIYRSIYYTFSVLKTFPGTFAQPQGITVPVKSVTRRIPCIEKPQVHVSDEKSLRDGILAELGIFTPEYLQAVDKMLGIGPSKSASPSSSTPSSSTVYSPSSSSNIIQSPSSSSNVIYSPSTSSSSYGWSKPPSTSSFSSTAHLPSYSNIIQSPSSSSSTKYSPSTSSSSYGWSKPPSTSSSSSLFGPSTQQLPSSSTSFYSPSSLYPPNSSSLYSSTSSTSSYVPSTQQSFDDDEDDESMKY